MNNIHSISENSLSTIKFQDPESIKFPKNCIYCGKSTDRFIIRNFYGKFDPEKDYKNNYEIKIPLCLKCQERSNIKKGIQNFRLSLAIFMFVISSIGMILLILNTYAYVFGITIIALSFIIPFFLYRINVLKRISISDVIEIEFDFNRDDLITISMRNKNYIDYLKTLNEPKLEEN